MVRSSGRIVGPFSTEQIPELLKSRELQLRDEISAPFSRWFMVERHPDFIEVAEHFKREILSEKTEFSFTPTASGITQTTTDLGDSELTEEITNDLSGFTNTKEIVVENVQDVAGSQVRNLETAQYQLKGLESSPYVKGKSRKVSYLIQGLALVCALGIAGFLFLRFQNQRPMVEKLSIEQVKTMVLNLIDRGEYKEALSLMQSKQNDPGFVSSLGIYFSVLSLQQEEQSLSARRILDQLLQHQPEFRVQILTALGLSHLIDQDYARAKERFSLALSSDGQFLPARVDLLITRFLSKDGRDFANYLTEPWVKKEPEGLLTLVLNEIRLNHSSIYNQLVKTLEVYMSENHKYRSEANFLAQYLKWRMSPDHVDFAKWEDMVDADPDLTSLHRQNVFIYRKHLAWNHLLPLCQKMTSDFQERIEGQLVRVFCYYQAKRFQDARSQAERLVDRNPKHSLSQAWYALALKESGSPDQASVALGRAIEADRKQIYRLPLILQGRFCENSKNWNCAEESWKRLIEADYNNLAALAGLAKISHLHKSESQAEQLLSRGLAISADYKPFLNLKEEWRSSN